MSSGLRLLVILLLTAGNFSPMQALFCDPQEYLGSTGSRSLTDFDGDGIGDVGLHTSTEGVFLTCYFGPAHDLTNRLAISGGTYGEVLVDKASTIPIFHTPGDRVGPTAPQAAEWRGASGWLLETYSAIISTNANDWQIGPLTTHDTLWAGVRFRTVSGTNYGWMKLAAETNGGLRYVRLVTNSFNPLPDSAVTVGEFYAPLPVAEGNWVTNTPIKLLNPLDVALEKRSTRDENDHSRRTTLSLKALRPVDVLAANDYSSGTPVARPVLLPNFRRIPKSPARPQQWLPFQRLLLLETSESFDPASGGYITNRTGPLADGAFTIGVRITNSVGNPWAFPLSFASNGGLMDLPRQDNPFPIVGVTSPFVAAQIAEAFDLNEDGWIDFAMARASPSDRLIVRRHESIGLLGLGPNRVAYLFNSISLPFGSLISEANRPEPGAEWNWSPLAALRYSEFSDNPHPLDVFIFTTEEVSYVGIQFSAEDGIHLGWMQVRRLGPIGDFYVVDYSFNPSPGQPIRVGQRMVSPHRLRISYQAGHKVVIDGNVWGSQWMLSEARGMTNWRSLGRISVVESAGEDRYEFRTEVPADLSAMFFRLDRVD